MAASFEVAGQRVDYGSHRLHPATPRSLLALLDELLGDDLQVRQRSGRIGLAGHWIGFPLQAKDMARNLPPKLTARLVGDAALSTARQAGGAGARQAAEAVSFFDVVTNRFGRTVAEQFYGPYAHKLYGIDARLLHPELAARRVSATSPTDIAKRVLRATRPQGRTFLYPRHGYGQIVERVAEAAAAAGAEIKLDTRVTTITTTDDHVTIRAGGDSYEAPTCLSTVPLAALVSMSDPSPPDWVVHAMARVKTRAMVLVYLVLDQPQYSPFDAHYMPDPGLSVARLSEPKNYRAGDDPPDRTVLCAEIACWQTDDIWEWSPDQLAQLVMDDLARAGLPEVRPVHTEVRRLPSVYPVFDIATTSDRAVIDHWLRQPRPVVNLGRQGLRVIDNLHHVMAMGAAAASSITPEGAMDWKRWTEHLDHFAANTVED